MAMRVRSAAQCLTLAIISMLVPAISSATETFTYGVDAGVGETDNVNLAPSNKVSQTLAVADVDVDYKQQSRLFDVDAKGNFTDIDYLQGAYSNQLVGRFDGTAHASLIPEKLTWALNEDFGQGAVDPFAPSTPTNLEDINYVSTGPDLALRLGPTSYINLGARFARAQYETSPFDSNRALGTLAWGLQLSAQSTVSLNGNVERVMFDNTTLNTDYDRNSVFGRYEIHGARTDLTADLGATSVKQDGTSTTGGLGRIELSRKLSTAAKLTLSAGRTLTDASASFSGLQSGALGVVGTAPAAQTSNNYTSNYASLGWQYQRNRTTISVSARWEKDDYDGDSALDNTRSGAEFRVARRLTRAFTAEIFGRYYKTDYPHVLLAPDSGSPNYDDEMIAAALTWRHGRGLEIKLRCEHTARLAAQMSGYGENRALLTVGYRPYRQLSDPSGDNPQTASTLVPLSYE
jgi:hypothetical protein